MYFIALHCILCYFIVLNFILCYFTVLFCTVLYFPPSPEPCGSLLPVLDSACPRAAHLHKGQNQCFTQNALSLGSSWLGIPVGNLSFYYLFSVDDLPASCCGSPQGMARSAHPKGSLWELQWEQQESEPGPGPWCCDGAQSQVTPWSRGLSSLHDPRAL